MRLQNWVSAFTFTVAIALATGFIFSSIGHAQTPWVIGQSAPLTGSNLSFGIDTRDGALAYLKTVNAEGGIEGRQIELLTLDDKNDRKIAAVNTVKLLQESKVSALFGFVRFCIRHIEPGCEASG